jgi:hypothetical protein
MMSDRHDQLPYSTDTRLIGYTIPLVTELGHKVVCVSMHVHMKYIGTQTIDVSNPVTRGHVCTDLYTLQ